MLIASRYRWAFVGEDGVHSRSTSNTPDFIPHVTRIAYLMDAKVYTIYLLYS